MINGSGQVLFYRYDHGGRLTSVADEAGEIVSYCHTPGGKVKEFRHRNGVKTAYEYDTEGNLIRLLTETRDGGTVCDLQYAYDRNGNRTAKAGTMLLPDHLGGLSRQIRDIHYRYDRMDRLTAEVRDGEETSYLYDLCGNRLEKRKGGRTERYRYNRKNQLVRRAAGGDAWDYTYDLQGNLVRETGPKGERQYLYDAENRQIHVLSGGKEIQENRYDGEGMRAGLTVNGKKSTFLYGDGDLYAEFDETGAEVSRCIWGNGLAGLRYRGELYGAHRDEQLSTGWVTGGEGVPENAYEYEAFGMLLGSHEDIPNRLLYGGQQYDAEVEQYYLRARYYNPVIGRFMQEDTYRGDGLNLYAYCANDPVMYHDPSGRNAVCDHATDAEKNAQRENVMGSAGNEGDKVPRPGDADFIGPLTKADQHFIMGDGIGPKKKGVLGAHNMDYFYNTLKSTGVPLEELLIGEPIPHPDIEGIFGQKYRVPAYDGKGNRIGYKDIPDMKTIYDPNIISKNQMLQWGWEAMKNGTSTGRRIIQGTASNGLIFRGFLNDNGIVTNFFPILPQEPK